jgi:hypothetical protein
VFTTAFPSRAETGHLPEAPPAQMMLADVRDDPVPPDPAVPAPLLLLLVH